MATRHHQLEVVGSVGLETLGHSPHPCCLISPFPQGAMAATYSALNSSKPTPQLKPIESSVLAQRRVRKLPSTTL
jgi:hypothetical protein